MITLVLSILSSTVIFVIFKLFTKFKVDTFQAIVFNYLTAFTCGFALYGNEWNSQATQNLAWFPWAFLCAILFISLFVIMGWSSQTNGLGKTSVAVKMSMAVSVLGMIWWYNEDYSLMKISGIVCAFFGVALVSKPDQVDSGTSVKASWMLPVLFFGSGLLDLVLKNVETTQLKHISSALFAAVGFGLAGIIGLIFLSVQVFREQMKFEWKNVLAGVFLGIPNYFSIYLLIEAYHKIAWESSTILAVNNVSIVLISGILGFTLFKERLNAIKILGVALSVSAILLLLWGS
jgi:drug/metabolite transporter (DMT)-like permease